MKEDSKRGYFLTGFLLLQLIGGFSQMISILNKSNMQSMSFIQQVINSTLGGILFVSVIGILFWKKIFLYSYIIEMLAKFIFVFTVIKLNKPMIVGAIIGIIIQLVVTYALIKLFKYVVDNKKK